jgi:hypothetical protein
MPVTEQLESRSARNPVAENGTFFANPAHAMKPLIATRRGAVSLFPFMSILASLIGILSLLIGLSMAVNQKKEGMTEEDVKRAQEAKSLAFLLKQKKDELDKSKPEPTKNNLDALELEKLKLLLLELEKQKNELDKVKISPEDELKVKIQLYTEEKIAIEKGHPPMQKKIDELKAKVAALKEKPVPKESVKVKPPKIGAKAPRNIFFIECNSTGIVLRGTNDETKNIPFESIKSGSSVEFHDFCINAKQSSGEDYIILFLVRKGGLLSYQYATALAELDFKVKVAKLPIPNDGKIDLSGFRLKKL